MSGGRAGDATDIRACEPGVIDVEMLSFLRLKPGEPTWELTLMSAAGELLDLFLTFIFS